MSAFKEYLVNAMTDSIATIGESKMEAVLQTLHDKNPEAHKAVIEAGKLIVEHLQPIVLSTKTTIDDMALSIIWDAVRASAKANNIPLA